MSSRRETRVALLMRLVFAAFTLVAADLPQSSHAGPAHVDLELVLAVDASDSMSRAEMRVQREGYVAALRSADVAAAIMSRGGVALAYMEWAGPQSQSIVVPLTILSSAEDAARFADALADAPLSPGFTAPPWATGTSISQALLFAAGMFSASGGAAQVIDISDNGANNSGDMISTARDRVVGKGVTINGLPVITRRGRSRAPLALYYEDCVIGGPGAFAMTVDDPSLFEVAIRRKLVLEIAGPPVRLMHAEYRSAARAAVDCTGSGYWPSR